MAWLLYDNEQIPWHSDNAVNNFAKHYLGYGKKEDKEFIVRARIGMGSLIRYYFRDLKSVK